MRMRWAATTCVALGLAQSACGGPDKRGWSNGLDASAGSGGGGGTGGSGGGEAGQGGSGGWGGFGGTGAWGGSGGAGGSGGSGDSDGPVDDVDAAVCGESTMPLPTKPKTPDVIITFDRSGSMDEDFAGMGTKYEVEARVLKDTVTKYASRVRFAFNPFPGRLCGNRCCSDPVTVPMSLGNANAIAMAIDSGAPGGGGGTGTPTPGALKEAGDYYAILQDDIQERYVLLSTDGQPTCVTAGGSGGSPEAPCNDSIAAIDRLVGLGLKVIVLGVGQVTPGGTRNCLEEMGARGGAPRPGGPPSYYPATDPASLQKALEDILGNVSKPTCFIDLQSPPPDPKRVAVYFDGVQIPWDTSHVSGWDWDVVGARIRFYGEHCRMMENFLVKDISLRFGCRPCGGTVGCPGRDGGGG